MSNKPTHTALHRHRAEEGTDRKARMARDRRHLAAQDRRQRVRSGDLRPASALLVESFAPERKDATSRLTPSAPPVRPAGFVLVTPARGSERKRPPDPHERQFENVKRNFTSDQTSGSRGAPNEFFKIVRPGGAKPERGEVPVRRKALLAFRCQPSADLRGWPPTSASCKPAARPYRSRPMMPRSQRWTVFARHQGAACPRNCLLHLEGSIRIRGYGLGLKSSCPVS